MRVLMVAAEVAPLAKVGGLADVMGALPQALAERGVDVAVAMPCYRGVREQVRAREGGSFSVPVGDAAVPCTVYEGALPDSKVPLYLLAHEPYFDRPQIYGEGGTDYEDALERFVFLSRGALALPGILNWEPDIVHAHDWHTALVPVYMHDGAVPTGARTVFTIHNLAYQGFFPQERAHILGLSGATLEGLHHWGQLNLLKGGIRSADLITTVSPTYAREILRSGDGLREVLEARADALVGVLNGVDYRVWDPERDALLWRSYAIDDLSGKATNKQRLQETLGLLQAPSTPLVGMVTRLVEQKGLDLVVDALERVLALGVQLVFLGTGDPRYEAFLLDAAERHPGRVAGHIGFSEELAHRIEAGCDMFLMPSKYEPCGLNQLYSLRYGTVPVVRATGGLADTVREGARGNGFVFSEYTAEAMLSALSRAVEVYRHKPVAWQELMRRGMRADHSWEAVARVYRNLYRGLRAKH